MVLMVLISTLFDCLMVFYRIHIYISTVSGGVECKYSHKHIQRKDNSNFMLEIIFLVFSFFFFLSFLFLLIVVHFIFSVTDPLSSDKMNSMEINVMESIESLNRLKSWHGKKKKKWFSYDSNRIIK